MVFAPFINSKWGKLFIYVSIFYTEFLVNENISITLFIGS